MSTRIFIIDNNVLVAGLITSESNSPTAGVSDAMLNGSLFFLLSAELLREYRNVLLGPRIARLHGLNEAEIDQILTEITADDPQDAHLWALLASEPTAVLITGDRPLIEDPRPQSSVISPVTWAESFQK
jgi:predicted nucleic acid-binding protein